MLRLSRVRFLFACDSSAETNRALTGEFNAVKAAILEAARTYGIIPIWELKLSLSTSPLIITHEYILKVLDSSSFKAAVVQKSVPILIAQTCFWQYVEGGNSDTIKFSKMFSSQLFGNLVTTSYQPSASMDRIYILGKGKR